MHYVTLPGSDLRVSAVCLGTDYYGSRVPQADAFALLDAFVEQGGSFIDTARIYAAWLPDGQNASEKTIGAWLQSRGLHDQIVLGTKGGHPDLKAMHIPRLSPDAIAQDITASLLHLQVDRIDLYWLHRDDPTQPASTIIDMLNDHVRAGQIRYLGCSNWTVDRIQAANAYAQSHDLAGFIANQPMWSLAAPNPDRISDKTLAIMGDAERVFHRATGMAVMPYSAQAKGYFTKLANHRLTFADDHPYSTPANHARFERAQILAAQHGVSVTAIVLSYLTSQPFPVVPIIGSRTLDQLRDSLQDCDLVLSAEELAYLDAGDVPAP